MRARLKPAIILLLGILVSNSQCLRQPKKNSLKSLEEEESESDPKEFPPQNYGDYQDDSAVEPTAYKVRRRGYFAKIKKGNNKLGGGGSRNGNRKRESSNKDMRGAAAVAAAAAESANAVADAVANKNKNKLDLESDESRDYELKEDAVKAVKNGSNEELLGAGGTNKNRVMKNQKFGAGFVANPDNKQGMKNKKKVEDDTDDTDDNDNDDEKKVGLADRTAKKKANNRYGPPHKKRRFGQAGNNNDNQQLSDKQATPEPGPPGGELGKASTTAKSSSATTTAGKGGGKGKGSSPAGGEGEGGLGLGTAFGVTAELSEAEGGTTGLGGGKGKGTTKGTGAKGKSGATTTLDGFGEPINPFEPEGEGGGGPRSTTGTTGKAGKTTDLFGGEGGEEPELGGDTTQPDESGFSVGINEGSGTDSIGGVGVQGEPTEAPEVSGVSFSFSLPDMETPVDAITDDEGSGSDGDNKFKPGEGSDLPAAGPRLRLALFAAQIALKGVSELIFALMTGRLSPDSFRMAAKYINNKQGPGGPNIAILSRIVNKMGGEGGSQNVGSIGGPDFGGVGSIGDDPFYQVRPNQQELREKLHMTHKNVGEVLDLLAECLILCKRNGGPPTHHKGLNKGGDDTNAPDTIPVPYNRLNDNRGELREKVKKAKMSLKEVLMMVYECMRLCFGNRRPRHFPGNLKDGIGGEGNIADRLAVLDSGGKASAVQQEVSGGNKKLTLKDRMLKSGQRALASILALPGIYALLGGKVPSGVDLDLEGGFFGSGNGGGMDPGGGGMNPDTGVGGGKNPKGGGSKGLGTGGDGDGKEGSGRGDSSPSAKDKENAQKLLLRLIEMLKGAPNGGGGAMPPMMPGGGGGNNPMLGAGGGNNPMPGIGGGKVPMPKGQGGSLPNPGIDLGAGGGPRPKGDDGGSDSIDMILGTGGGGGGDDPMMGGGGGSNSDPMMPGAGAGGLGQPNPSAVDPLMMILSKKSGGGGTGNGQDPVVKALLELLINGKAPTSSPSTPKGGPASKTTPSSSPGTTKKGGKTPPSKGGKTGSTVSGQTTTKSSKVGSGGRTSASSASTPPGGVSGSMTLSPQGMLGSIKLENLLDGILSLIAKQPGGSQMSIKGGGGRDPTNALPGMGGMMKNPLPNIPPRPKGGGSMPGGMNDGLRGGRDDDEISFSLNIDDLGVKRPPKSVGIGNDRPGGIRPGGRPGGRPMGVGDGGSPDSTIESSEADANVIVNFDNGGGGGPGLRPPRNAMIENDIEDDNDDGDRPVALVKGNIYF